MKKKTLIFIILLCFCFVLIMPGNIYADSTNATVYISFGVVVGGAALFFSFAYSERYSKNKERSPDEEICFSAIDPLKIQGFQKRDDDIPNPGMVKIFTW